MPDRTEGAPAGKAGGEISKKEAVRRALKSLGQDAKPTQIREHVKKRYHIDMGLDHISNAKSEVLKELREAESGGAKPIAARPPAQQPAAAKPTLPRVASGKAALSHGNGGQGISLKDIETVKELVERVGATPLKKLIDVMAR